MTDKTEKNKSALIDAVLNKDGGYELAGFIIEHDLDGDTPYEIIKKFEGLYIKDNFDAAARIAMKYLAENHHPHTTLIITADRAEIVESVKSTGEITDYLRD